MGWAGVRLGWMDECGDLCVMGVRVVGAPPWWCWGVGVMGVGSGDGGVEMTLRHLANKRVHNHQPRGIWENALYPIT